jgi:hypothetical protein
MEEYDMNYERIKMTNKARDAARSLAVCYHEYCEAIRLKQSKEVSFWGNLLFIRQKEVGVNIIPDSSLNSVIKEANEGLFQEEEGE